MACSPQILQRRLIDIIMAIQWDSATLNGTEVDLAPGDWEARKN